MHLYCIVEQQLNYQSKINLEMQRERERLSMFSGDYMAEFSLVIMALVSMSVPYLYFVLEMKERVLTP